MENFDESFPSLENLQYLNLRENKIEKFEEIQKLTVLVALDSLVISFNPIINKMQEKFYFELMNIMSKIKRINKVKVSAWLGEWSGSIEVDWLQQRKIWSRTSSSKFTFGLNDRKRPESRLKKRPNVNARNKRPKNKKTDISIFEIL